MDSREQDVNQKGATDSAFRKARIDAMVATAGKVMVFPQAGLRALQLLENLNADSAAVAKALALDPALSAGVLRLANSAIFRRAAPADTVEKALFVLGRSVVSNMVIGYSVVKTCEKGDYRAIQLEDYWRHSLACSVLASELARRSHPELKEIAFTAGLLHDIGQLALMLNDPEAMREAFELVEESGDELDMHVAETRFFGLNHCDVGGELARSWQLPDALVDVIRWHHTPLETPGNAELVALVHVANRLAVLIEIDSLDLADAPAIEPSCAAMFEIRQEGLPELLEVAKLNMQEMQSQLFG